MKMNKPSVNPRLGEIHQELKQLEKEAKEALHRVLSQFTLCGANAARLSRDEALMVADTLEGEGIKNVFPVVLLDGHWMVMRMKKVSNGVNPGSYERLYFRGNR